MPHHPASRPVSKASVSRRAQTQGEPFMPALRDTAGPFSPRWPRPMRRHATIPGSPSCRHYCV
ncbi:hypothetical protein AZ78_3178 [Lysobacter capsici AZ78]|uniref:Uncharacterized protein n=1 Tax=Lysobacter capsici AZ78 TaxID=1444315 RepID=A0A108UAM5_9GAMM|nr:hypothetical protein AZ78_3178 [Lysobacter capsici AZ78]